jgi:hypothetical protein
MNEEQITQIDHSLDSSSNQIVQIKNTGNKISKMLLWLGISGIILHTILLIASQLFMYNRLDYIIVIY